VCVCVFATNSLKRSGCTVGYTAFVLGSFKRSILLVLLSVKRFKMSRDPDSFIYRRIDFPDENRVFLLCFIEFYILSKHSNGQSLENWI